MNVPPPAPLLFFLYSENRCGCTRCRNRSHRLQLQAVLVQQEIPQADGRDAVFVAADLDVVPDYDDLAEEIRNAEQPAPLLFAVLFRKQVRMHPMSE